MRIVLEDVKIFKVFNEKGDVFLVIGLSKDEVIDYVENDRCQFDCYVHKDFKVEENLDTDIFFYVDDLNTDCFSINCDWNKYTYKANTYSVEQNMSDLIAQYQNK